MTARTAGTSLAKALFTYAQSSPEAPAMVLKERSFSYAELSDLVASFAIRFDDEGVDETSVISFKTDDPVIVLVSIIAASILNAKVVILSRDIPLRDLPRPTHSIVVGSSDGENQILVDASFSPHHFTEDDKSSIWDRCLDIILDPAFLYFEPTSGGSEKPAVVFTQQEWWERTRQVLDERNGLINVACLWPTLSYQFASICCAQVSSGRCIIDGLLWDDFDDLGVQSVSSPLGIIKSLYEEREPPSKVSRLELGMANLDEHTLRVLLLSFDEVRQVFETPQCGAVYANLSKIEDGVLATTGSPCENAQVLLVDSVCIDDVEIGKLACGTDHVPQSTDLIVRKDNLGKLDLLTRDDHCFLDVSDKRISASLLEAVLQNIAGITEIAVFSNPKPSMDNTLAFVVYDENVNRIQVAALVNATCVTHFGPSAKLHRVLSINSIPKDQFGRIDRVLCAQLVLDAANASTDTLE